MQRPANILTGVLIMPEGKGCIINSDEKGSINISEEVVAVIAATAAADVAGVHKPFIPPGKEFANMLGIKGHQRGVKLVIEDCCTITIDVSIIVEGGYAVNEVGAEVQKAVMTAVEDSVGVRVSAVNVNISGIALGKKDK